MLVGGGVGIRVSGWLGFRYLRGFYISYGLGSSGFGFCDSLEAVFVACGWWGGGWAGA